jgi:hypothetical protein
MQLPVGAMGSGIAFVPLCHVSFRLGNESAQSSIMITPHQLLLVASLVLRLATLASAATGRYWEDWNNSSIVNTDNKSIAAETLDDCYESFNEFVQRQIRWNCCEHSKSEKRSCALQTTANQRLRPTGRYKRSTNHGFTRRMGSFHSTL